MSPAPYWLMNNFISRSIEREDRAFCFRSSRNCGCRPDRIWLQSLLPRSSTKRASCITSTYSPRWQSALQLRQVRRCRAIFLMLPRLTNSFWPLREQLVLRLGRSRASASKNDAACACCITCDPIEKAQRKQALDFSVPRLLGGHCGCTDYCQILYRAVHILFRSPSQLLLPFLAQRTHHLAGRALHERPRGDHLDDRDRLRRKPQGAAELYA
jgi:hypothetical protein